MRPTARRLVFAVLLAASLLPAVAPRAADAPPQDATRLIATLMPQVVNINFVKYEVHEATADHPASEARVPVHKGVGTGYVIDARGIIATNRHVTDGGDEIFVTLFDHTRLRATLIYRSPSIDLALLRVQPAKPLTPIKWGDSDRMLPGMHVIAIGNPLGLGGTVTTGIVSARDRDIKQTPLDSFMQIDAAINPGNSGGPLFNTAGEVVGMNTALFTVGSDSGSIGLNFAIPGNDIQFVLNNLRQYHHMRAGYLGATLQDVGPDFVEALGLHQAGGAIVADVLDGSPAAAAGLQAGDVILRIGKFDIANLRAATRAIAAGPLDEKQPLVLLRDGHRMTVQVTLTERSEGDASVDLANVQPKPGPMTRQDLGVDGKTVTDAERKMYGLKPSLSGLVLTEVKPGSLGAFLGFEVGDVIMKVQNVPVQTLDDVVRVTEQARRQKLQRILVLLTDDDGARWIAVPITR